MIGPQATFYSWNLCDVFYFIKGQLHLKRGKNEKINLGYKNRILVLSKGTFESMA